MGLLAAQFFRIELQLMTTARLRAETTLLLHPAKQNRDVYEATGV